MPKQRRCKIAIVTHELTGGVGTMTRFLYRVLSESPDYEPAVVLVATSARDAASVSIRSPASWARGPLVVQRTDRGMPYIHVGAWLTELEFQRYQPRRALDELLAGCDVIQFVTGAAPWAELARRLDKPRCIWVATTIVGDRSSRASIGSLARRLWSRAMMSLAEVYERRALRSADSILALSPYTAASIGAVLDGLEVQLAPCGVDTELYTPRARSASPDDTSGDYILCVARLFDARKNVRMLLHAYASMLRERPDLPGLRLVGEPLSPEVLRLLDGLGIGHKVRCYGPTHGEELAKLYRDAMLFVLPSHEEGLGIVILEAMASGIPVVSTACGGPEAVVADGVTGFLTPVGDPDALARAMLSLIDDRDLRDRLGAAARRKVEEGFSLRASGDVFLAQYESVSRNAVPAPASA